MHARIKTFSEFKTVGVALLTVSLLASVALNLIALGATERLPVVGSESTPAALPKAYSVDGQGEGRIGPAISSAATTVKAHWQPYMGEGRLNVVSPNATRPIVAHASLGQGEGWVGGGLKNEYANAFPALTVDLDCVQAAAFIDARCFGHNPSETR